MFIAHILRKPNRVRWLSQFDRKKWPQCEECGEELADSHLFRNFNLEVCDKCKETEKDGKHELITKTDAKNEFLLKDTDFVRPEPALKFIARKNPHKESWGEIILKVLVWPQLWNWKEIFAHNFLLFIGMNFGLVGSLKRAKTGYQILQPKT